MSPVAAPELRVALVVALVAGVVALAGAAVGAAAVVLAVPAGIAGWLCARRVAVREAALRRLSQSDALTGLGNRRLLAERLVYEIARHARHDRSFALFALDLDGFKGVNDRFGHAAGDEVLREIACALRRTLRDQDTLVRVGGDEFCVLVPESSWSDADHVAARLRSAVRGAVGGLDTLAVSVGYAIFPDEGRSPEALLARADAAAIEAKRRRGVARRAA